MRRFVVIASSDNRYVRRVIRRLCEQKHPPHIVLVGSRAQRILFKLQSFRRIRSQIGLLEALRRLIRSRSGAKSPQEPEPSMPDLQSKYRFDLRTFDAMNSGIILASLRGWRGSVAVLAGAGLADSATIGAVGGRCINAHPAILPGIRGVDVLEWSLVKRRPTGVSAHLVVPSVDAGDVLKTEEVSPNPGETFDDFAARLVDRQADILAEAAIEYVECKSQPTPQDLSKSEIVHVAPRSIKDQARQMFSELSAKR
ncbi:hypothetical protein EET67_19150 [Pseudaminobacter arsenicus]|uniref:phosphoribosylglycinamide formyltransferase 1 n=1 Tax=Borborobacter arsenicus TaxID=1851146 RepID=A0A432V295_9HYPH|nr:formyltransferase family protein [Pseudaminobacter arsenicus]RUM96281.1 hypothetical protein EET67_19150 [Pseudaminobacter arsenicus]